MSKMGLLLTRISRGYLARMAARRIRKQIRDRKAAQAKQQAKEQLSKNMSRAQKMTRARQARTVDKGSRHAVTSLANTEADLPSRRLAFSPVPEIDADVDGSADGSMSADGSVGSVGSSVDSPEDGSLSLVSMAAHITSRLATLERKCATTVDELQPLILAAPAAPAPLPPPPCVQAPVPPPCVTAPLPPPPCVTAPVPPPPRQALSMLSSGNMSTRPVMSSRAVVSLGNPPGMLSPGNNAALSAVPTERSPPAPVDLMAEIRNGRKTLRSCSERERSPPAHVDLMTEIRNGKALRSCSETGALHVKPVVVPEIVPLSQESTAGKGGGNLMLELRNRMSSRRASILPEGAPLDAKFDSSSEWDV